jgi:hypothetical protein
MASSDDGKEMNLTIKVRQVSGDPDINNLPAFSQQSTIADIKKEIEKLIEVPVMAQRLIYKGKVLQDGETLGHHKVTSGDTFVFQVVKKLLAEAKAKSEAAQTQSSASSSSQADSASPAVPAAAAPATSSSPSTESPTVSSNGQGPAEMIRAIDFLCSSNNQEISKIALTTLSKVIENIITHPLETKYQKIKKSNAVFDRKLGGVIGGQACILATGFIDDGEGSYVLSATAEAWDHINACRDLVASRVQSFATAPPPVAPSPPPAQPTPFAAPPMMGSSGNISADMMALASNPQVLQQAMNNPMAQQLFAQNPAMRSRMEEVLRNPEILQQSLNNPMMQQMMRDPAIMQQAMQMMGGMGGAPGGNPMGQMDPAMMQQAMQMMGGMGAQPAATPPTAPTGTPAPQQTPSTSEAKTEEELIAEAIARSLEEK